MLYLFSKIKKLKPDIGIIAHQHAKPPFKYYNEIPVSKASRLFSSIFERVFRAKTNLINGFVVINKKTYKYLAEELGVSPDNIVYQHVGIDYEAVSPQKVKANNDFWGNCEYRLIMSSIITWKYGGIVRGIDLVPRILDELKRNGYKPCIAIAGEILDPNMATTLKARNVILTGYLPRQEFYSILAAADVYILPARKSYYYGGIGVATIEAMALN
jgi:glycosyltransferase involved in cell wall biosynthesis